MTQKLVARQSVAALLKKAGVSVSTKYPSSSKYERDTGIVVEACSADGSQQFKQEPTRIKGRFGYYQTTKDVLIEEVVRLSWNITIYSATSSCNEYARGQERGERDMAKAQEALEAAGYIVTPVVVKRYSTEKSYLVVSKESN